MRTSALAACLALAFVSACAQPSPARERVESQAAPVVPPPALAAQVPLDAPGVHNVVAYGEALFSGSAPEGEEGFQTLASMGIRTILSVDGAAPDVAAAKAHGMRYVHLPITYSGFSEERKLEIAQAVRDLPGPTYIHCHHGKHRSAGAAGAAAVVLGLATPEEALARMQVSGTAPNYKGLFRCVAEAEPVDPERLDRLPKSFPEVSRTSGLVDTMVEIDEVFDSVKALDKAQWGVPADHPDLVPAAVAGQLENLFRGLDGDPDLARQPSELREWMRVAAAEAQVLEDLLVATRLDAAQAAAQFRKISQSCKDCHAKYRD